MNVQVKRESAPARVVPWDPEIEQALLGAILVNNDAYDRVSDVLRVEHFHEGLHQRIYDAIAKVIKSGRTASPNSLRPYFELDTGIQSVGGTAYLAEIAASTPAVMYALEFAQLIIHHHVRRNMVAIADEITAAAIDPPPQWKPEDHINEAERRLFVVAGGESASSKIESAATIAARVIAKAEQAYREPRRAYVSTGLEAVDYVAGGLFSGDLIVLGGATSMGKTALAQQIGWNVASGTIGRDMAPAERRNVLAFTMEMDEEQYVGRHVAQIAGVSFEKIEAGTVSHDQMLRVIDAQQEFLDLPLYVDGGVDLSVGQVRTRGRRFIRKHGPLSLLVVDHLRFMRPDDVRAKEPERVQQLTKDLKTVAKELQCCVLLITHLNRDLWQRTNHRPILADCYGGAAIEQNADVVIFVHRESYYLKFEEPDPDDKAYGAWFARKEASHGKAEIICAKRRRGRTGTAHTLFEEELTRFSDLPRSGNNNQNQGALL